MTQKLFKLISIDEFHNFSLSYHDTNNNKVILLF
jgi:hypothetical protein